MKQPAVILIVDDSPEQIHVTGSILAEHGYEVLVASSGKAALSLLERELPDLILLDIHMNDMDGFSLCQKLRSNPCFQDTAVIFMTISQDRESLEKGFALGAQDYIIKPCHASELLARVGAHVRIVTQSKELKTAYRELDQFCHTVSHDLKSPLQVIKQLTQLLQEELTPIGTPSTEDSQIILERLEHKCESTEAMISRLLEFSEMVTLPCRPKPVDTAALIGNIFAELSALEPDRHITLELGTQPFPQLSGDPTLLTLLFQNILGNAIKFTRIRDNARICVTASCQADMLLIKVQDNGAGFDMASSGRLFHIFERLHTSEEFEGSGVGLVIVKRIMERHGGFVSVKSKPDSGTAVSLFFPTS
ncbi:MULTISPECIES: response regulator [Blautia]|uniref:response regulator n=1 Tax=Blautia TaxID=572511 RepID=UPI000BA480D5|nr:MULTISPECIES: response regulator [Blautia]